MCTYILYLLCSGIDFDHPDFGGHIDRSRSVDYIDSNGDGMDFNGHGTHCAGNSYEFLKNSEPADS